MIFAVTDYLSYRLRKGKYGENTSKNLMAMGFFGPLPDSVTSFMENGDTIFTQRLDSIFSWGTMYFTQSDCDHCAVYIGNNQIMHMTLGGCRVQAVDIFDQETRILPLKMIMPDGGIAYGLRDKNYTPPVRSSTKTKPYTGPDIPYDVRKKNEGKAKRHIILLAFQMQLGIVPECFSKSIFFDNIIIASVILWVASSTTGISEVWLFTIALIYVSIGPLSQFFFKKRHEAGLYVRPSTKLKNERLNLIRHGVLVIPDWNKIPESSIKAVYRQNK